MKTIDLSGKPCPIPVIEAKKTLAKTGGEKTIFLIDNMAAVENLKKMATSEGYDFSYEKIAENSFKTFIGLDHPNLIKDIPEDKEKREDKDPSESLVVTIGSNYMGSGSNELGKILMKSFIYSLTELENHPQYLIFFNTGVYLTTEGSNTIEDLKTLEEKGTVILSCGTCLNFFELQDKLVVGTVTDMYGTTEKMALATKLINI